MTKLFKAFVCSVIISTHILTKRMTASVTTAVPSCSISTHILTKRMTAATAPKFSRLIFQLTSSRRGWPDTFVAAGGNLYFNSHPHEEDDRLRQLQDRLLRYFNSHPHEEDDNIQLSFSLLCNPFQLTSSRRGWRNWTEEVSAANYFNSHPHEEDDVDVVDSAVNLDISTHILTKRMTISIGEILMPYIISTHILTKRMTILSEAMQDGLVFQLTSSRRGWLSHHRMISSGWDFNSHPHEEDDLAKSSALYVLSYFNSHPHEEDDYTSWHCTSDCCISTHILTKRMTDFLCWWNCHFVISTHILTKRMTDIWNVWQI